MAFMATEGEITCKRVFGVHHKNQAWWSFYVQRLKIEISAESSNDEMVVALEWKLYTTQNSCIRPIYAQYCDILERSPV